MIMTKKKEKVEKVRCMDCKHHMLLQWDDNPVIVACIHLACGKDVANTPRECPKYIKRGTPPQIKKLSHYT